MESPARQISLVPAPDGRQSETALAIARGTARLLRSLGFSCVSELPLPSGRRADLVALNEKGEIWIVEIKSSVEDLRADQQWGEPFLAQLDEALDEGLVCYPRKRMARWDDAALTGIDPFEHRVADREADGRIGRAEKPILPECGYAIDLDIGAKARTHLHERQGKPARDLLQGCDTDDRWSGRHRILRKSGFRVRP